MKRFDDLMKGVSGQFHGPCDAEITGLENDSRTAGPGDLFVAIRGTGVDSHRFISQVKDKGVTSFLIESGDDTEEILELLKGQSVFVASDTRQALGLISSSFFGHPSRDLFLLGITGTNGKTTSTYMAEYLLKQIGFRVGVIGTISCRFENFEADSRLTTPGPIEINRLFRSWVDRGATAVAMEVSNIALDQHRVTGLQFDIGIFTNLTRDHLDYHGTMENYFEAKAKLFEVLLGASEKPQRLAMINTKDPWGAKLFSRLEGYPKYQLSSGFDPEGAEFSPAGVSVEVAGADKRVKKVNVPMVGRYNLDNAMGVFMALVHRFPERFDALNFSNFPGVPGRLEVIPLGRQRFAYIDYAHTPDALENALEALTEVAGGNPVHTVFGCGGDRDRGKRPLMAAAAEKHSARVYVTSDNPRFEDPQQIVVDVLSGFSSGYRENAVESEVDRRTAILQAVKELPDNALLLVAGKGHEPYQEIRGERSHLLDREIVEESLAD